MRAELESALSRSSLASLDGLRAIAVFLVVIYHSGIRQVNGGLGVLIFFVISGFLITWLLLKEEERWGDISLKLFYLRRTLRIFPAFYAYWLLVVVGIGILGHKRLVWPQAWASLLYVSNYWQAIFGDPQTGLSHTWSLAVEEQFYLLWPVSFLLLRNNRRRMRTLQILIPGVWVHRYLLRQVFDVPQGYIYEALDTRADHLLIGCLLAILLYQRSWVPLWNAVTQRSWTIWITLLLLAVSCFASQVFPAAFYRDLIGFIVDPILTAILIVQGLAFSGTSAAWLNSAVMTYPGRISYSIYLYQQIAIHPAKRIMQAFPAPVQVLAAIAVTLAAASFSYYVIERPFLRLKDKWGKRTTRSGEAAGQRVEGRRERPRSSTHA